MYTIIFVSNKIPEFLNRKYLEWQVQTGERKTISEFARLFGASQPVMSQWMSGERSPGPEYKQRIIQHFGAEAIQAFGEDPDLYYIQHEWDELTPAERHAIRQKVSQYRTQNETERTHKKRRTSSN